MSIKYEIQELIAKDLKEHLLFVRKDVKVINESKSKRGDYKPYTKVVDDNLYKSIDESTLKHYSSKGLNEMRAITSSSALTYNTFCNVGFDNTFEYNGFEYHTFIPESKRHPLNFSKSNDRGKSNIDAELIGDKKVLMIETKMFEPYYFSIKKTITNLDKYLDSGYYSDDVFTEDEKEVWIELIKSFKDKIEENIITNFDIMQFIKHLLSIVNNRDTFENKEVELLALTWHASFTTLNLKNYREVVKKYDIRTTRQCIDAIGIINKFLIDNHYDWITVNTYDYNEFVWRTNLYDDPELFHYLKRYTTTTKIGITEIMDIELIGLCKTILEVSNDHFTTSYCNQLSKLKYPEDKRSISILVSKILAWYDEGEYEKIILNEYSYYKQEQVLTYRLLNLMARELGVNKTKPVKRIVYKEKPPIELDSSFGETLKIKY